MSNEKSYNQKPFNNGSSSNRSFRSNTDNNSKSTRTTTVEEGVSFKKRYIEFNGLTDKARAKYLHGLVQNLTDEELDKLSSYISYEKGKSNQTLQS